MWPFQSRKGPVSAPTDTKPNPRYFGSVIAANGQPGSGKTFLVCKLAFTASFRHRLPLIMQDTRGDLSVYHRAAIKTLENRSDAVSKLKLELLRDKSRCKILTDRNGESFLALLEEYSRQSSKEVNRTPKAYALVDEGGVLRRGDESFWDISSGFRNSGITAYTSVHKDTDISRVGRQCLRAVILQRPYEGEVEFYGVTIPAGECSPPMSNTVTYIDSFDRTIKRFDINTDSIPECLTHPVQPTKVSGLEF
jgi:hypothetical protein